MSKMLFIRANIELFYMCVMSVFFIIFRLRGPTSTSNATRDADILMQRTGEAGQGYGEGRKTSTNG